MFETKSNYYESVSVNEASSDNKNRRELTPSESEQNLIKAEKFDSNATNIFQNNRDDSLLNIILGLLFGSKQSNNSISSLQNSNSSDVKNQDPNRVNINLIELVLSSISNVGFKPDRERVIDALIQLNRNQAKIYDNSDSDLWFILLVERIIKIAKYKIKSKV